MLPSLVDIPDVRRESRPYCFFRKVGLILDPTTIIFNLDAAQNYMIERVHAEYPCVNVNVPGYAAPLKITLLTNSGTTGHQMTPFIIPFITTPGERGVAVDTAPGANPAYPFTATHLDRAKGLNILCHCKDFVQIQISNITAITTPGIPTGSLPSFFEIMVIGRYFPEEYAPYFKANYQTFQG